MIDKKKEGKRGERGRKGKKRLNTVSFILKLFFLLGLFLSLSLGLICLHHHLRIFPSIKDTLSSRAFGPLCVSNLSILVTGTFLWVSHRMLLAYLQNLNPVLPNSLIRYSPLYIYHIFKPNIVLPC